MFNQPVVHPSPGVINKDATARRMNFAQNQSGSSGHNSIPTLDSSDDDECGRGILEFSPDMAGRDVTPAPEILQGHEENRRSGGGLEGVGGGGGSRGSFNTIAGIDSCFPSFKDWLNREQQGGGQGKRNNDVKQHLACPPPLVYIPSCRCLASFNLYPHA